MIILNNPVAVQVILCILDFIISIKVTMGIGCLLIRRHQLETI